ncbi:rhomboid family intramembrane serine protease [Chthonobacter rhizosphaerae]|uniref:rhomboid family intramembrane serine protease n=1 Tax=Chthonobacter rhizosphaerae TaxID=2735553 RepID=UPI0015EF5757|nr:rhomboid family intramembrane serine protease [Chthonobacter rhizosphaerae]
MSEPILVPRREPVLNLPRVITALLIVLAIIHLVRTYVLWPRQDQLLLLVFSFIPARYEAAGLGVDFPGGALADLWTPLTYGLLHGDFVHLAVNGVWLAAFGSALAWRFGAWRFLLFSALATMGGAAAHYFAHSQDFVPMVGASGAISGHMAAVSRFMFQTGGPLGRYGRDPQARFQVPAVPLSGVIADRRVLGFLAIWFAINLLAGFGTLAVPGEEAVVAWEAHVGGFLTGLLLFDLFDPVRRAPVEVDPYDRFDGPDRPAG